MRQLFTILCLSGALVGLAKEIYIVRQGAPAAVIVQGRQSKSCLLATEILQFCLKKSTGVELQVIRSKELDSIPEGMNRIFIGDCDYAKSQGLESEKLQMEEYRALAKGRDIFFLGHNKEMPEVKTTGAPGMRHPEMDSRQYSPATLWAVTTMLDQIAGVRFLWPGDLGTYCPKRKSVALPEDYSIQGRPFYERRQMWFDVGTYMPSFDRNNRFMMIHQQGTRIHTNFTDAFQGWWEKYGATRPELVALSPDGKRTYHSRPICTKVCISNPEVPQLILERWRAAGRPDIYGMCPNDGLGFCTCPNCRELDSEEARQATAQEIWLGKVSLTRRYVKFWNAVLTEMKKENPKAQICVFGYGAYKLFPQDMKLVPGVLSAVVPSDFDVRGIGMTQWRSWQNSGARLLLRPNWMNTFWFSPYFPLKKTAEFMRAAQNISFGYEQDSFGGCWPAQGLYCYMLLRMSYLKNITVDDIKEEYASAFGKGAAAILKWIAYWEEYTDRLRGGIAEEADLKTGGLYDQLCATDKRIRPHILYGCWDALHLVYPPEIMKPAYDFLDEADNAIGGSEPEATARVQFLRDGMRHVDKMIQTMNLWWEAPCGRSPAFMASFNELFRMRREFEKRHVVNAHQLMYNEFARRIRIVPCNEDGSRPSEEVYVREWMHKE
ncbi:MAG: DUF4838 domain-containing protein [Victivallales bacterium]|nr:DUF4838 domain-containing protein [Victivallales bacterium]